MKIFDGRNEFYQWDIDRQLIIEDAAIDEVHFCNRLSNCSLVCGVYEKDGLRLVNVPNILLQSSREIRAYAYCGCYTRIEKRFKVNARSKPEDYIYTETEIKSYADLEQRIDEIEKNGVSDEVIKEAVSDYLENNKIETGATAEQAAQIEANSAAIEELESKQADYALKTDIPTLNGYATEDYVDNSVADVYEEFSYYARKSEIPSLDGYAQETYVDNAIAAIPKTDLSNYATKTYVENAIDDINIPSIEGLATEAYVNKAVAEAQLGGGDVDLTGYATEKYVDDKIAAIPETDLSNYYTKAETNTAINNAKPDLTPYAKKTDIPSVEGLATETYVNDAVAGIDIPSIEGLATEQYVDDAIANIDIPEGGNVDLSDYYTKTETDNAISEAVSGIDVSGGTGANDAILIDVTTTERVEIIKQTVESANYTFIYGYIYGCGHTDNSAMGHFINIVITAEDGSRAQTQRLVGLGQNTTKKYGKFFAILGKYGAIVSGYSNQNNINGVSLAPYNDGICFYNGDFSKIKEVSIEGGHGQTFETGLIAKVYAR